MSDMSFEIRPRADAEPPTWRTPDRQIAQQEKVVPTRTRGRSLLQTRQCLWSETL